MRPRPLVASTALTAVLALVALPGLAGSHTPSRVPSPEAAAFQAVLIRASDRSAIPLGPIDAARHSASTLDATTVLVEPAADPLPAPAGGRPDVAQPGPEGGAVDRPPRYTVSGLASFYDNGTTAMRLPRGTTVRICGAAGCIVRVVNDYGPSAAIRPVRIADLYRRDFFAVCGCPSWSGTTEVTIGVY